MNISTVFVKRPVMTILVFITISIFGVMAYIKLPVSELPTITYPIINIDTSYSGANPTIVAEKITTPLEEQFMQISGLESMLSSSSDGRSSITLSFKIGTDISYILTQIQSAVSRAKKNLPDLPSDPEIHEVDPSSRPIIELVVSSDTLSHQELYDLVNKDISEQLSMLSGVSDVTIRSVPSAIIIKLDPQKMAAYDISLSDIKIALKNENVDIATGSVENKDFAYSIETKGQLTKPSEYNNIIISYRNNKPVKINNIGLAYQSVENELFNITNFNDSGKKLRDPIIVQVSRQTGSNTIEVASKVKALISNLKNTFSKSVDISIFNDTSTTVIDSINDVKLTLVIAFILVVLVIFIFMGRLRDTFIPSIVMPVSILSTFLVMYKLGYSIDNLSLMALTLSVGFIVDDAIVVLENNSRYIEQGIDPINAALKSAKEITGSVISMTFSLIVVFIPLVFMQGSIGLTFKEFAMTIIIVIICSGVVSLTLTPMMNSKLLKVGSNRKNKFQIFKDKVLERLTGLYGFLLSYLLKKYYITIFIWLLCIIGSVLLFIQIPKTLLPDGDSGNIFGMMQMPLGTSSTQARKFQNEVNQIIKNNKNVSRFFTITGLSTGADQSTGIVNIMLKPENDRESISSVVKELRRSFAKMSFPLGKVFLRARSVLHIPTGGNNTASGAEYSYTIKGSNQNEVYACMSKMTDKLKKNSDFEDIQTDVNLNMRKYEISILRNKAGSFGITADDIENALALAFAKGKVTDYTIGTNIFNVIVQNKNDYAKNINDLAQIYVKSSVTGKFVPLVSVVDFKECVGPQQINHYQGFVSATISFNLRQGVYLGTATNEINKISKEILPSSVQGTFLGTSEVFVSAMYSLAILIIIAIFLKYVILGILYESFIHPITVLSVLPVATVGGLGTLFIFNSGLSLYAYIGMFLLIGLVAKNGIMIVDFTLQRMKNENMAPNDAVYSACLARFRPIVMTGLTSIASAIPIAVGIGTDASLRQPLGLVVVGGLIVSQLISLFMTPSLFLFFHSIGLKLQKDKFRRWNY